MSIQFSGSPRLPLSSSAQSRSSIGAAGLSRADSFESVQFGADEDKTVNWKGLWKDTKQLVKKNTRELKQKIRQKNHETSDTAKASAAGLGAGAATIIVADVLTTGGLGTAITAVAGPVATFFGYKKTKKALKKHRENEAAAGHQP